MKIAELVATRKERGVPVVYEHFSIEETIDTMLKFRHSRLVYVLNENDELTGTISLGMLMRHSLSPKYEPKIHPRLLIGMLTAETAKDIMLKNPVFASEDEDVELVVTRMIDTNVKEIAILNSERKVIADITMLDLLESLRTLPQNP
ncbi:MAG: CBS domain-containing protein [Deltaproteobacteria bacterium]|nr:CBS domain-containing protein [Deltaproteobacteria bacterium]